MFCKPRELRSCSPSSSRFYGQKSLCLQTEASIFLNDFAKTVLDGDSPTRLHIDFRTRRPNAIDFSSATADQRAACSAIHQERTRGILKAAQLTPSGESLPVDVWNAIFAQRSKQKGVPLIPLERFGANSRGYGTRWMPQKTWGAGVDRGSGCSSRTKRMMIVCNRCASLHASSPSL